MLNHRLTKYRCNGRQYATAWIQLKIFGRIFIFSEKTIEIPMPPNAVIM